MTLKIEQYFASSWSIDSRTIQPGDFFIALRGDRFNGHDYVDIAMERGAVAALVDHPMPGRVVIVPDTQEGLENLGRQARQQWGKTVVAITGSAGKTTTKDIIASLLSIKLKTAKTVGNLNNDIGVPLSILRIPDDSEVAVLEMGMNHTGEISHLCSIAKPNIGVITNIGYAHIENFESINGIAHAKGELIDSLGPDGIAILNSDDPHVLGLKSRHSGKTITYGTTENAQIRATDIESLPPGGNFTVDGVRFHSSLIGKHNLLNILAGIATAQALGIPLSSMVEVVNALAPSRMRGERMMHQGIHILNDSYNSNPDAVQVMIDTLMDLPGDRKIAVLGEMLELGAWSDPLHHKTGTYAAGKNISILIGIQGKAMQMIEAARQAGMKENAFFFHTPEEAGNFLKTQVRAGDSILFKGSRGTQVEKALERFLA